VGTITVIRSAAELYDKFCGAYWHPSLCNYVGLSPLVGTKIVNR